MIRRVGITSSLALAAVAFGIAAGPAHSADFYAGKQVKLVIGFGFGGTYGKYSRMFAEHLKRHIPGNPNIIVESRPGAGGMKMTNYAANVMPADGLNFIVPPDSSVIVQLMRPEKAKYDMRKFTWLGSANQTNVIVVVRSDTGVKTWQDLRTKEVVMGSTGLGSTGYIGPRLINSVLGTKMKVISGYKGSSKTGLAVEQGEAQGAAFNWLFWRSKYERWFKGDSPYARALLQIGHFKDPDLPDVPMVKDLIDKKHKPILSFVGAMGLIGRGIAAPPGTPADKIAIMRTAFAKMVKDADFVADSKKRKLRVIPATGEQIQTVVSNAIAEANPAIVAEARKLIYGK